MLPAPSIVRFEKIMKKASQLSSHSADATRSESDSFGPIEVPADRYWGAQTQRSLQNFKIGGERLPASLIHALGLQKRAGARANIRLGELDQSIGKAIIDAAGEVADGR